MGMHTTKRLLQNLLSEESGQDMMEYALIAALIALAAIAAMGTLGNTISNYYNNINSSL